MPTLLFYDKPTLLNREAHRKLKVRDVASFAYAAKTISALLTGSEFAAAARHLPILFVSGTDQQPAPIALQGLRRDENLFVEADGRWSGNYIPAFVRRYPFVLFENPAPNGFMVGIDEAYSGFNATEGVALFADDGTDGPALKRVMEFLNAYHAEATRTREFSAHLKRLDLLVPQVINVTNKDGSKHTLDGFSVVDEARLTKLDEKEAGTRLRSGYLGWIYMHLLSMHNLGDLNTRLDARINPGKSA